MTASPPITPTLHNTTLRHPDGSAVWTRNSDRTYVACRPDGSMLRDSTGNPREFATPEAAGAVLAAMGFGTAGKREVGGG